VDVVVERRRKGVLHHVLYEEGYGHVALPDGRDYGKFGHGVSV